MKPYCFAPTQIPWSNIGQVADISLTPWVTLQEADITRHASEAACWLQLGCWSNNFENSHPSPGGLNVRVLCSCLVPQCSYPFYRHRLNDALRIVFGCLHPTPADNLPILAGIQPVELRRNGITLSLAWSLDLCSTQHSPVYRVQNADFTAPQIKTPIWTCRTATHQFIWQQHTCSALGVSPLEWGVGRQTHKTPHFHPWHQHPLEWPSQEQPGFGLIPSAPVSDVSNPTWENGVWSPLWPMSVAQKNKLSTMLSSNVQSINLLMDCTASSLWMMRQLNGCLTPALGSSASFQLFRPPQSLYSTILKIHSTLTGINEIFL